MKLLIDDEKIGEMADSSSDNKECPASFECLLIVTAVKAGAQAELDHLAKLGIVYVEETENVDKCSYNGESHCTATSPDDCEDRDSCEPYVSTRYIPLSDYMKGEVK